jgi:endonuclease/exonuclease/phosphatase family metal-dependent hydrolase
VRIRVVVYNVRGFRDDVERLVRHVEHVRPDLVLLNESGARWRLRRFSRAVGMRAASDPWSPLRRRVKNAILVRPPWRLVERRLDRFAGSARWYPRGALVARLERGEARLMAISMHLGLLPRERLAQVRAFTELVAGVEGPLVVGGDLNERPDGRSVAHLSGRFRDAWLLAGDVAGETYPAREPSARIDYLFVSDDVAVLKVIVPPGPDAREASDHLPVIAELTLP